MCIESSRKTLRLDLYLRSIKIVIGAWSGVDKSKGYFAPAMIHAALTGRRVLVSTFNNFLKRQIATDDGPQTADAVAPYTGLRRPTLAMRHPYREFASPIRARNLAAAIRAEGCDSAEKSAAALVASGRRSCLASRMRAARSSRIRYCCLGRLVDLNEVAISLPEVIVGLVPRECCHDLAEQLPIAFTTKTFAGHKSSDSRSEVAFILEGKQPAGACISLRAIHEHAIA